MEPAVFGEDVGDGALGEGVAAVLEDSLSVGEDKAVDFAWGIEGHGVGVWNM